MQVSKREARGLLNIYFVLIWIVTFMIQISQNTNNNASISYAVSLGMSTTLAGMFAIPYMIGAIVGRICSGYVSDYISRRKAMMLGSFSFLLGCVLLCIPLCANAPCIMLARAFHGFGFACTNTAATIACVDVAPPKSAAIAIGLNFTGQALAQATSGFLVDVLVTGTNYLPLFIVTGLTALVSMAAAALCRYRYVPALPPSGRPSFASQFSPKRLLEKKAIPMSLVSFAFFLGLCFASFYTVSIALSRNFNVGAYFTFSACSMVFSNIVLVNLGTRFGAKAVVIPAYAFCAAGLLVMSVTDDPLLFSMCGMTYGISLGTMPLLQNEIVKRVPAHSRGKGASTLFIGQDIAMGIGTFLWGGFIDAFGFFVSGIMSGTIVIAAAALLSIFLRKSSLASD